MAIDQPTPLGRNGRPRRSVEKQCLICGGMFRAPFSNLAARYCSRQCYDKSHAFKVADRFWLSVEKTEGCWLWKGAKSSQGYGQFGIGPRMVRPNRLAWELTYGEIPTGLLVCHHCDNKLCVRPDHLFLGTSSDNTQDMLAKGRHRNQNDYKTHCPSGHEYTVENTKISRKGWRYCRTCERNRFTKK